MEILKLSLSIRYTHWSGRPSRPRCVAVPYGSRLQEMKPKATHARKIAAFRMLPYSARSFCSQLCCLALALLVAALPLADVKPVRAPILTPLGAEPVPLGTGLQLPSGGPFQPPSLLTAGRLVLGPL